MRNKYPFLSGTILLTLTGFLTKIIGFFYRIFLSRSIGEEGMGIYQLLAPIMALSYAFTSAGIQTAISKYTAAYHAQGRKRSALATLLTGFLLSILLSVIATVFLYQNAAMLAARFLLEPRCEPLIRIFALSIPFASIHSCINGYYYGLKKTLLPSASLLVEQLARVLSVYAIYTYGYTIHTRPTIAVAMLGVLIGEVCSTLLSTIVLFVQEKQAFHLPASFSARAGGRYTKEIMLLGKQACPKRSAEHRSSLYSKPSDAVRTFHRRFPALLRRSDRNGTATAFISKCHYLLRLCAPAALHFRSPSRRKSQKDPSGGQKMPACLSAARQYLLSVSALLRYLSRETAF